MSSIDSFWKLSVPSPPPFPSLLPSHPPRVLLETLGRRVILVFPVAKDLLVSLAVLELTASL